MMRHYLDHNATSPQRPEVTQAVLAAMEHTGNPMSVHAEGRAARRLVEDARRQIGAMAGAPADSIVFTGGGTEAICLALHGSTGANDLRHIFVSAIEHPAVLRNAERTGATTATIPVTPEGVVDLEWLQSALDARSAAGKGPFLVCLTAAGNETGVIQPVRTVADMVHRAGGLLFCDAAQAFCRIPVDFTASGADMTSITAHKSGGPHGAGALITRPGLMLRPVMEGGGHEMNRRAGTHNVPAIAGFGRACELAGRSLAATAARVRTLRDDIEHPVRAAGARIWGAGEERLPGTLCLSAPGFSAEKQLMILDLAGIAVSSGPACSSGRAGASHVLAAMGATAEEAASSIRISLGWSSCREDVRAFLEAWLPAFSGIRAEAENTGRHRSAPDRLAADETHVLHEKAGF